MTARHPPRSIAPAAICVSATATPAAAPPYATRSMIVMELSCIVSTRIVMRRNFSACSFISACLNSSAW